ncbi:cation efflux protein [Cunninghamella echinulata]|nr:cation efflux protein [Cunninghamella echinulata]
MFSRISRIKFMMVFTSAFFIAEIVVGYYVSSLALVADSFHMLNDLISLIIAYGAIRLADKTEINQSKYTYGWQRAEILGALLNGVFLLALCFTILMEAIERFVRMEPTTNPMLVLIVGCSGLAFNVIGLFLFHEHGHGHGHEHHHESSSSSASHIEKQDNDHHHHEGGHLNMKGIFLHVLGDALGNVGVIVSALVIWLTPYDWRFYMDPAMSLLISIIIFMSALPLVKKTSSILLQGVPSSINLDQIRKSLEEIPDVYSVHELHIWQLSDTKIVASLHVLLLSDDNYMELSNQMRQKLHEFGVHSSTIQPEYLNTDTKKIDSLDVMSTSGQTFVSIYPDNKEVSSDSSTCLLQCIQNESCYEQACCKSTKDTSQTK